MQNPRNLTEIALLFDNEEAIDGLHLITQLELGLGPFLTRYGP